MATEKSPKRYFWLKLPKDFFNSKEMRKLRRLAGGEIYVIIYLKMMLMTLATDGVIYYDGVEDTFAEELALELDEDVEHVTVVVNFLSKWGLLTDMGSAEFLLPQAKELMGSETAAASRMRNMRERQRVSQKNIAQLDCLGDE